MAGYGGREEDRRGGTFPQGRTLGRRVQGPSCVVALSPLRLGIVGCGSLTERGLLPHLSLVRDRVRVTALCDISDERLRSLSARFDVPKTYTHLSDFLAEPDLDAVAIATPIPLHYEQSRAALDAGHHVYVQKTMAGTGREARELLHRAAQGELTLAASPGQMALPAYTRARELVEAGRVGRVFLATGTTLATGHETEPLRSTNQAGGPDPAWYYAPGSGPLRDMGVYLLHAITGILGFARRVSSLSTQVMKKRDWGGTTIRPKVDDNAVLSLELDEDRLAVVSAAYSETPVHLDWGHLAISGSEGAMEVRRRPNEDSAYELLFRARGSLDVTREAFGTGLGDAHDALEEAHVARDVLDFIEAVREGRSPLARAVDACHVIDIIEASERAAATGRVQTVPPPPLSIE